MKLLLTEEIMEQIKTKGLILKVINLNDNDRIFTVLTKDNGKITVMAKGIRSQKNKYFGAMQLFCFSDFIFEKKTGMYYPVGAELVENFFDIRNSVEKVALATYIADIVNAIPDEFPLEDDYFRFILNTLYMISKADEDNASFKYQLLKLKSIFEFKTTAENGYAHSSGKCSVCGCTKDIKYFDLSTGCSVCEKCSEKTYNNELVSITPDVYNALCMLEKSDLRSVFSIPMSDLTAHRLSDISSQYMKYQLEIFPPSGSYFQNILQIDI